METVRQRQGFAEVTFRKTIPDNCEIVLHVLNLLGLD